MAITEKTVLARGTKDKENTKILQKKLGLVVDGYFGPITEKAVRAYQKKKGLVVDGVAGPVTLGALGLISKNTSTKPVTAAPVKSSFHLAMEKAIGGTYTSLTGFYLLVKYNEKYFFEMGDTKNQEKAIQALLNGIGLNCVNYAQLAYAVAEDLNKTYKKGYKARIMRTYCIKDKVGHVYLSVTGGEFGGQKVDIDLAAAAGSGYDIGKTWCQSYPVKTDVTEKYRIDDRI